tara:strand:+ start:122 stop:289 length:168 start_codon:yes stop_codon:yes gene_type:complete
VKEKRAPLREREKKVPLKEREKKVHQLDLMESLLLKVKALLKVKKDHLLVRMEKY